MQKEIIVKEIQRLEKEREQLGKTFEEVTGFINTDEYQTIPISGKVGAGDHLLLLLEYNKILNDRIYALRGLAP